MTTPEDKGKTTLNQSLFNLKVLHAVKDLVSWLYVSFMLYLVHITVLPSTAHISFHKVMYLVLVLYLISYTVGHGFASGVFSRGELVANRLQIKGEHQVKGLAEQLVAYVESLALKVEARNKAKGDDTQSFN